MMLFEFRKSDQEISSFGSLCGHTEQQAFDNPGISRASPRPRPQVSSSSSKAEGKSQSIPDYIRLLITSPLDSSLRFYDHWPYTLQVDVNPEIYTTIIFTNTLSPILIQASCFF